MQPLPRGRRRCRHRPNASAGDGALSILRLCEKVHQVPPGVRAGPDVV